MTLFIASPLCSYSIIRTHVEKDSTNQDVDGSGHRKLVMTKIKLTDWAYVAFVLLRTVTTKHEV